MKQLGTLYHYELKKLLKRKLVWIMLAVCLIAIAVTILAGLAGSYEVDGVKVDTHYHMFQTDREYQKRLEGREVNQQLLAEMSSAYGRIPAAEEDYITTEEYWNYARPYREIFNLVRDNTDMTVSEVREWAPDEDDLYKKRAEMLEKRWQGENLSAGEKAFWRQKESGIKKPFVYHRTESYFMLFRAMSTIGVLVLLSVAVCLPGIFSDEHTRRTDQLILCSTHGKGTAYWAKILAGISCAAGISLVLSLFAFGLTFAVYGTEGFHAMFQLVYAKYAYPLTAGEGILILYGCLLVTAVMFSVCVMLLSEMLHSSIAALAVSSGTVILGMVCYIPPQYRVLAQIWDWLPNNFFNQWNVFDVRLFSVFGGYFTAWQAVPVIYLLVSIGIVAAGKSVYRRYQVSGR